MKKKQINSFLIFIFSFTTLLFSTNSYSESFLKKNTYKMNKKNIIKVSQKNLERLSGYLSGSFYSQNLNKKFINVSGVYYAISKDGNNSSISFCDADHFELCAEQMLAYQTLGKCEKISNQKCFLIFRGKVFLPTRENKINLNKYFVLNTTLDGNHLDIYGKTLEEFHNPDD